MKITFVIPTHNEEMVIEKNLQTVLDFFTQTMAGDDWRIVVADNGSSDRTVDLAQKAAAAERRLIVWHTDRVGRGQALRQAWQKWPGEVCAYMDADLATDLNHVPELIRALQTAEAAIGSRLASGAETSRSFLRELSSRIYNRLTQKIIGLKISDAQCGFKAFSFPLLEKLLPLTKDDRWFFDTELLALAQHYGYRLIEMPVKWREQPDKRRKSTVKIFATSLDYLKQLFQLRRRLAVLPKK
jgi:glycosyltransferase involved in cell wall biosynthesis